MTALADAGLPPSDPVLRSAASLPARRGDHRAGRLVRPAPGPRSRAAGPSSSPTTTTPTSTTRPRSCWRWSGPTRPRTRPIDRGVAWIEGMQCRDGGWAAFDVDNTQTLCRELPFCDFGELIDPPSADVTAHVVEMLAKLGRSPAGRRPRRGVAAAGPGGGRLLVRALGRQLRLRHRGRRPGARRRRSDGRTTPPSAGPSPGSRTTRTPTAAGARTCAPTGTSARPAAASRPPPRPPGPCSALLAAGERSEATDAGSATSSRPRTRPARGTSPGSPGPGSRATSTSTTTSTGSCSRSRPWGAT